MFDCTHHHLVAQECISGRPWRASPSALRVGRSFGPRLTVPLLPSDGVDSGWALLSRLRGCPIRLGGSRRCPALTFALHFSNDVPSRRRRGLVESRYICLESYKRWSGVSEFRYGFSLFCRIVNLFRSIVNLLNDIVSLLCG